MLFQAMCCHVQSEVTRGWRKNDDFQADVRLFPPHQEAQSAACDLIAPRLFSPLRRPAQRSTGTSHVASSWQPRGERAAQKEVCRLLDGLKHASVPVAQMSHSCSGESGARSHDSGADHETVSR